MNRRQLVTAAATAFAGTRLAGVSPEQALAKLERESLLGFTRRMFGPRYLKGRHLLLIADALERVSRGELKYLVITMPPRHAKSEHASVHFPAWHIGNRPDERVIACSYSGALAARFARRARNLVLNPKWPFPGVALDPTSRAITSWDIAGRRGGYTAAGVGGAITGMGADVLLVDDPVKNQEEANSEVMRENAWEWFTGVALTRLEPGGRVCLIGTRWHEDDLIGRALRMPGIPWEVLALPAEADAPDDPLGRRPGEVLWPERFTPEQYAETKKRVGPRNWTTQYQGKPYADKGGAFPREKWRRWGRVGGGDGPLPKRAHRAVLAVDSAFKTGVANDYSVFALWVTDGDGYYLVDRWRGRVEFPELVQTGYDLHAKWRERYPNLVLAVEDTAAGQSAIQVWRRGDPRTGRKALPVAPIAVNAQSKIARAEAVSPLQAAGALWIPDEAEWVSEFVEEHVAFPFGQHDDQVDTTSIGVGFLNQPRKTTIRGF